MRHHTDKPGRVFADLVNSDDATAAAEPVFEVDGRPVAQSEFIAANADDADLVTWAKTAPVGAWYPSIVDRRRAA
jgi:hypothetical protein